MGERTAPRPLRVSFVALNYAPSVGGAQELVRRIAEGLVERGHDVTVITTDGLRTPTAPVPGRIAPRREDVAGVHVRRHPTPGWIRAAHGALRGVRARALLLVARAAGRTPDPARYRETPFFVGPISPSLWADARRAAKACDVVVAVPAPYTTLVIPAAVRRRSGARLVALPLLHHRPVAAHWAVRWALRRADAVVTLTDFEAGLAHGYGVAAERTTVRSPGADPDRFDGSDAPTARRRLGLPERPTVGYVGRITGYKGVDTLLDAAPHIWSACPDTTVLLAGAASGWQGHREALDRYADDDRLLHLDHFEHEQRPDLLAACDVVAFASSEESFGMVITEAWCARRPVVVADIPVSREIVGEVGGGAIVPVRDAAALAEQIVALLRDPERAAQLGALGREAVEQRFGWGHVVDGWEQLLVRVVADDGAVR